MDPLGNLPVFSTVLRGVDPARRRSVLVRELLLALGFLVGFLLLGRALFGVLNLQEESVRIAGGLILGIIAFRMLFGGEKGVFGDPHGDGEPLLFPLAVPLVAGPATLSLLLLLTSSDPGRLVDWLIAVVGAWAGTAAILFFSSALSRAVGDKGLGVLQRLMGMLLVVIAVQMLVEGVQATLGIER
jgi:multiple antibiotic resistance protein